MQDTRVDTRAYKFEMTDADHVAMIERLRAYRDADQWPGRAQCPVTWSPPAWMTRDDEEEAES